MNQRDLGKIPNEESPEIQIKLFSKRAISIATFFGGPLAAGYLIKKNYDSLQKPEQGKMSMFLGLVSSVIIFCAIFLMPEGTLDKVPNVLIPAIYTACILLILEKTQGKVLRNHKNFYSLEKAAIAGIILMIGYLGIGLVSFVLIDMANPHIPFNANAYDAGIEKFISNEKKALEVSKVFQNHSPAFLEHEIKKSIKLWQENRSILYSLNGLNSISKKLLNQNKQLMKYCDLRLLQSSYLLKAVSEKTNIYDSKIESIGVEIEKILLELNTKPT
jgi:hypothetical protein